MFPDLVESGWLYLLAHDNCISSGVLSLTIAEALFYQLPILAVIMTLFEYCEHIFASRESFTRAGMFFPL